MNAHGNKAFHEGPAFIDFWVEAEHYITVAPTERKTVAQRIIDTHLEGKNKIDIDSQIKKDLKRKWEKKDYDETLFLKAQTFVFQKIQVQWYPGFVSKYIRTSFTLDTPEVTEKLQFGVSLGIKRGNCLRPNCAANCKFYVTDRPESGATCQVCTHPPADHANLGALEN